MYANLGFGFRVFVRMAHKNNTSAKMEAKNDMETTMTIKGLRLDPILEYTPQTKMLLQKVRSCTYIIVIL